jgi:hypothetical protein
MILGICESAIPINYLAPILSEGAIEFRALLLAFVEDVLGSHGELQHAIRAKDCSSPADVARGSLRAAERFAARARVEDWNGFQ